MSLRIAKLYGVCSLQGAPREGRRRFGVPPGGAFDQESHRLANALVGNDASELSLELGLATGDFVAEVPLHLALAGCDAELDGQPVGGGSAFAVRAGQRLHVGLPSGARAYLAVERGWSAFHEGQLTVLEPRPSKVTARRASVAPSSLTSRPLRVMPLDGGDPGGFKTLMASKLLVSQKIDRVGLRLEGQFEGGGAGASLPCCEGLIQRTPDGTLIILGPDGPTIGGYERIAVVCRADWDRLGQLRPGEAIQFAEVSHEGALDLWRDAQNTLEKRLRETQS